MKKTSTAIEISDMEIRGYQAEKTREKKRVLFYNTCPVPHGLDESAAGILKEMMTAMPVFPQRPVVLLPRCHVILRQMKLPSQDRQEIEDMIGLKLVNNLPYDIEEIAYRFHILEQDGSGYSLVLVVVVPREVVRRYRQIMTEAGIKDGLLTVSSFGVLGWLAVEEHARRASGPSAIAVLNIAPESSEICFCHGTRLFFSRDITCGGKPLTFNDVDELIRQTALSLEVYRQESLGPEVEKIWILSASREAAGLKDKLSTTTGLAVETVDPSEPILCSSGAVRTVNRDARCFSTAAWLGSLFSGAEGLVDLLSKEDCAQEQRGTFRCRAMAFGIFSLMVMLLSVSGRVIGIRKSKARLESLEARIMRLQPQWKAAAGKMRLVRFFDEELRRHYFVPGLLAEFNRLTPGNIALRRLSLDGEGNMTVQGDSPTQAEINDFQSCLVRSSRFSDLDLQFAAKRNIAKMSVMDFKITMRLKDGQKEAP